MNKKLTITLPLLFILCFGIVGMAFAQGRAAGVNVDDHFTYSITAFWSSQDPSATVPDAFREYNNTLWYKFTVTSIDSSNVTATDILQFRNGTSQPFIVEQNINSGAEYKMSAFQSVIAANLGPNDLLHPTGTDGLTINQTITRSYGSGERETNVLSLTYQAYNSTLNFSRNENITYYFDKATGMLVESDDLISYTNPIETGSVVWKLTDTNVWTVSTSQSSSFLIISLLIVIVAIIIVVLAVVFYMKRIHKRKPR